METRVAVISIIVENMDSVEKLNSILHDHGQYIIGRMGIPYREKGIHVISFLFRGVSRKGSASDAIDAGSRCLKNNTI